MNNLIRGLLLTIGALLLGSAPAAAFRLIPIEMEFEPSGRGATQIFRVENDTQLPIAIEVHITGRKMGPDGEDLPAERSDDWIIFPEQIVLEPNQSQSVRVQWTGTAAPDKELAYRLIAEQLDVDIGQAPTEGGKVKLLVQYKASLYVTPPGVKPQINVLSAGPRQLVDGVVMEMQVRNDGTAHKILKDPTLTLSAGGKSVTVPADRLGGLAGENVLPGVTRHFLLPWPGDLPKGPLQAKLNLP
ncbi:molecular chaperone [Niveispirillum sp. KHB5.9]|uniref:fimbrial biogenesis chaperone n=1 Tax=Niveispirillum sp. KHB5.9 TaxID=3400269 RepID=UPI003A838550